MDAWWGLQDVLWVHGCVCRAATCSSCQGLELEPETSLAGADLGAWCPQHQAESSPGDIIKNQEVRPWCCKFQVAPPAFEGFTEHLGL